jgi:hypothetical protein
MRTKKYTDEERIEKNKENQIKYLNKKYSSDEEFRNKKKEISRLAYEKKKKDKYLEEHGSLEGFKYKKYNDWTPQ